MRNNLVVCREMEIKFSADVAPSRQASLSGLCPVSAALEVLALTTETEGRGAVFTRSEVVGFILDLVGYTMDKPLHGLRLLEPSFGKGDFLLPIVKRVIGAWKSSGSTADPLQSLGDCVRAVELHRATFAETKGRVIAHLRDSGFNEAVAVGLAESWLINGDFLLVELPGEFDLVVGNPPYVRQELIPDVLLSAYRDRYITIYDRADLYVPFIERSLRLLAQGGHLGFICADRWMKNRYGGPLRKLIAEHFHVKMHVDMTDTQAFHADVTAYPAITVIGRERAGDTRIARKPTIDVDALAELANELTGRSVQRRSSKVRVVHKIAEGAEPWILEAPDQLAILRRLEKTFPLLEQSDCKVGIGVATGADRAFIGPLEQLDVEEDRRLPLVMTRDIADGSVKWRGLGVINPFGDGPGLVNLRDYPRLNRYLEERREQIAARHCAQKIPSTWYRTIDRITPALARTPKLLIPDIKGNAHVVYEDGQFYPHHNLYYITSDSWDLRALQAVLLSSLTRFFIAIYSTKMRGGFLRFQAQYLRRLRLPLWHTVSEPFRSRLIRAAEEMDTAACDQVTFDLYDLNREERAALSASEA